MFAPYDLSSKVTVSIRYSDLILTWPSQVRVLAWPLRSFKRTDRRSSSGATAQPVPFRLSYAEDALKTLSLPEGSSHLNHCLSPFVLKHMTLCWTYSDMCFCPPPRKFYLCFSLRWYCPEPATCSEEGVLLSGKWLKHMRVESANDNESCDTMQKINLTDVDTKYLTACALGVFYA